MVDTKILESVFLDRDGTLIKPIIKNNKSIAIDKIEKLEYYQDTLKGISLLKKKYKIFMVTNQPDVITNGYSKKEVIKINEKIKRDLNLDDYICCFGTKQTDPFNYKPGPGMILDLKEKYKIDLSKSFFIGDRDSDMMAAKNAGSNGVMIDRKMNEITINAITTVKSFLQACKYIINK